MLNDHNDHNSELLVFILTMHKVRTITIVGHVYLIAFKLTFLEQNNNSLLHACSLQTKDD
jgi:hypothetical protein